LPRYFYELLTLFWERLRLRGYPEAFLRDVFDRAPDYASRDELLWGKKATNADVDSAAARMQMWVTGYSSAKHKLCLSAVMHRNKHLLPPALRAGKFVLAYRAAPKLGAHLIPYRFPRYDNTTTE
jgi:hypothetical protein